jgi:hypothetical protein
MSSSNCQPDPDGCLVCGATSPGGCRYPDKQDERYPDKQDEPEAT